MLEGKKTYIAALCGAIAALALYGQGVAAHGFDLTEFFKFVNSEAIVVAFAAIRAAIGIPVVEVTTGIPCRYEWEIPAGYSGR